MHFVSPVWWLYMDCHVKAAMLDLSVKRAPDGPSNFSLCKGFHSKSPDTCGLGGLGINEMAETCAEDYGHIRPGLPLVSLHLLASLTIARLQEGSWYIVRH